MNYLFLSAQFLSAELLFLFSSPKRKYFWLRLLLAVAVQMGISWALSFAGTGDLTPALSVLLKFLAIFLLFLLSYMGMYFCFDRSTHSVFDSCAAGYATQHIASRIVMLLMTVWGWAPAGLPRSFRYPLYMVAAALVIYTAVYFAVVQKRREYATSNDPKTTAVSISIVLVCMLASRIGDLQRGTLTFQMLDCTYSVAFCALVLALQTGLMRENKKEQELRILDQLIKKEHENYRRWQNSIDVINVKCHDLKHQIADLRADFSEKSLSEIESAVLLYDNIPKTGNEILDILIYEKVEYCTQHDIEFDYMIEGEHIGFLSKDDIFALFGNIIDNAIENVEKEDPDKRIIYLRVAKVENMLVIREENYCSRQLEIRDGLPVTDKADKSRHGFGVLSIRMIAEQYEGTMQIDLRDDTFRIIVCLPCNK
ncbi:MAG: sensor histidine kinase [Lachnospiraceae bacterium]|nr:sensor histidine kinase [Lachnospiraceae bacterium]